ncbi:MAG TPA: LON peptidase substrate-binding domain-containing protein [Dehalococcoidia bacterium]|nr:LON peptidase substrate-binding domain-containing protein [Dehalococcoidia bacterium]
MEIFTPGTMLELPLFPLNTVLFPGSSLPLHVFEERYKQMMAYCLEHGSSFGIVLIKEGQEVGGPATPFDIGTVARISYTQRLDKGRLNLLARGEQRFRIASLLRKEPYPVALVATLASEDGDGPEAMARAREVAGHFADYYRFYLALSHQWSRSIQLPPEPDALADFVAGRLLVDRLVKQTLLETLPVPQRLAQEAAILEEQEHILANRVRAFYNQQWRSPAVRN